MVWSIGKDGVIGNGKERYSDCISRTFDKYRFWMSKRNQLTLII